MQSSAASSAKAVDQKIVFDVVEAYQASALRASGKWRSRSMRWKPPRPC